MVKVELINYFDVWGNPEEGWEVNNLCKEGFLELPEDFSNEDLLEALKDFGFLVPTVIEGQIDFEDMGDFGVELFQADNGCPLCRIEFVRE